MALKKYLNGMGQEFMTFVEGCIQAGWKPSAKIKALLKKVK
jgi:hypothetical protein